MEVKISFDRISLFGDLSLPQNAKLVVVFAHGSGSGRLSPRNQFVARSLNQRGIGTLLADLLTRDEEREDEFTRAWRFNIPLLANRLVQITQWVSSEAGSATSLPVAYFGASTGAAAALIAAAKSTTHIASVVSRGGRPDLAKDFLPQVVSPTLLIVGALDHPVIELNQEALAKLQCTKKMILVPGATHLFEEAGCLEEVARLAGDWFLEHLKSPSAYEAEG